MKASSSKFREVIIIVYPEYVNIHLFQKPINELFEHLAWMYSFQISIETGLPMPSESGDGLHYSAVYDLVHLRSTDDTLITGREFRKLISQAFARSVAAYQGIDLLFALKKELHRYPFPGNFYRIKYPYIEKHKNGKVKMLLVDSSLYDLLMDTEDYTGN